MPNQPDRPEAAGPTEEREPDTEITAPKPEAVPDPEQGPPPEGYGGPTEEGPDRA